MNGLWKLWFSDEFLSDEEYSRVAACLVLGGTVFCCVVLIAMWVVGG